VVVYLLEGRVKEGKILINSFLKSRWITQNIFDLYWLFKYISIEKKMSKYEVDIYVKFFTPYCLFEHLLVLIVLYNIKFNKNTYLDTKLNIS